MNRRVGDREGPETPPADADVRAERWTEIKTLLDGALEQPPAARDAWLAAATGGDAALASEVAALLALETEMGDFLERPVFDLHEARDGGGRAGEAVGAYRLQREIGRGGMGIVYLAERDDQEYTKTVAVKVLKRGLDTDDVLSRFRAERQILANLEHPNIARLIEGGTTTADHLPYFVLEHVDGRPIDLYCDEEELGVEERLRLFLVVCAAVAAAHRNLVVHRDLKPSNILVTDDGAPKLLDFGIAKLLGPAEVEAPLTRHGRFLLTPEYASPEQVWGQPVNTTTDVYSLGVLLFQLLTGRRPFEFPEPDLHLVGRRLREEEPPRPSSVVPRDLARRLTGDLDAIVGMALRKEPDRRYGSVEALAEDVRRHLAGLPVVAAPDSVAYRTRKFLRRHRAAVAAAATIVGLVVGFAVVVTVLMRDAVRERETADRVITFVGELFSQADPDVSRGQDTTVRQVLDGGRGTLLAQLGEEPEVKARLLHVMAQSYLGLGLGESARQLLDEAYRLNRNTYGPRSLAVAESLYLLAEADQESGNLEAAQAKVEEALALQRELGALDEHYLHGLNNLALIRGGRGDLPGAEALLREILAAKEGRYRSDDLEVANTQHNLAVNLVRQGRGAEARPFFEAALAVRRRSDASLSDLTKTLNSYAAVLEQAGELERAEELYLEALDSRRRMHPDGHKDVAVSLNNVALLMLDRGDAAEARKLLLEAEPMMPPETTDHAIVLRNLAAAHAAGGDDAQAEELIRNSLAILRAQEDPNPWRVADAQSVLGGILSRTGRAAEAEPLLLAAYLVVSDARGPESRYTRQALERIIALYTASGAEEQAATYRKLRVPPPRPGVANPARPPAAASG